MPPNIPAGIKPVEELPRFRNDDRAVLRIVIEPIAWHQRGGRRSVHSLEIGLLPFDVENTGRARAADGTDLELDRVANQGDQKAGVFSGVTTSQRLRGRPTSLGRLGEDRQERQRLRSRRGVDLTQQLHGLRLSRLGRREHPADRRHGARVGDLGHAASASSR